MTFDDFDLEGVKFPHDDPLVITPIIGNNPVKRVLVDNGVSVDILLHDTFIRMGSNDSQLTPTDMPIYGFTVANGQAEVADRIILDWLKKRIEKSRNNWVVEVLPILWAYRTTCRVSTGATPFMLAYGAEAVIPVEISHSSPKIQAYNAEENEEGQRLALYLIYEYKYEEI
ncbi:uncharacterized protein LOC141665573 [Apium graveolens]|uniref:uncharacterized protein LOC141665573 n=1 Tax=Apium graveolens TaxID=4045 RepID=UPI003D7BFD37